MLERGKGAIDGLIVRKGTNRSQRGAEMRLVVSRCIRRRRIFATPLVAAGCVALSVGVATKSYAQTSTSSPQGDQGGAYSLLLPPEQNEIADQERLSWTLSKFPTQPYMREFYWQLPSETPAFFSDSLLQVVARTYYLTRENSDGSRSQAFTGGG